MGRVEARWTAVGVKDVRGTEGAGGGAKGRVGTAGSAEEGEEVECGGYGFGVEDEGGEVGPWEVGGLGSE